MSSSPIGIFDSGVGGLTVLRTVRQMLPHENLIYFADTAHVPYGEKSPDQILKYSHRILEWMQNEIGVKLVIIACHTSSVLILDFLSDTISAPIIGTIVPTIDAVLQNTTDHDRIGILATPVSVKSRIHEIHLLKAGYKGAIHSIACPAFVPLIEAGELQGTHLMQMAKQYLAIFDSMDLNILLYGCTHYPWIASTIQTAISPFVKCIDPAEYIAIHAMNLIKHSDKKNKGSLHFYCSAYPDRFSKMVSLLLGIPAPEAQYIQLYNQALLT